MCHLGVSYDISYFWLDEMQSHLSAQETGQMKITSKLLHELEHGLNPWPLNLRDNFHGNNTL